MRKKPILKTLDMTAKNAVAPPSQDRKISEQMKKPKTISIISRHGKNSKQRFWAMEAEETGIMLWNEDPKKWEFLKIEPKKESE